MSPKHRIVIDALAADEQAWNEQALAAEVTAPQWRVWSYARPAIVLGNSQRRLLDERALAAADPSGPAASATAPIELLVRRSGGGAVLVGPWMIGVSVALPPAHPLVRGGPVPSYRWLGSGLAQVLRNFGVAADALSPTEVAERGEAGLAAELRWACFGGLSPWEAVVGGRKITGLAQVRRRFGVLLVAGVLVEPPDWRLLCDALQRPAVDVQTLENTTTCCRDQGAPDISPQEVARAIDAMIELVLAGEPAG